MSFENSSLKIGPYELPSRAFLAPMAGITNLPFRKMAMRFGAGLVVSEMIASEWLASGDARAVLRGEREGTALHVIQLAGCEAHWLAEGARIAEGAGAHIIDINMGCPAKSVTTGQAGAALLRDIDQAERLIVSVISAVSVPVTLKMRLGWDENSIVAPKLARRAENAGVALVTVHGRTRAQFYNGKANWAAIAAVKSEIKIPLVANGDLATYDDALTMGATSRADALMVGRGARGRPWFVGQVGEFIATGRKPLDPPLSLQRDVWLELYESWLELYGTARGMREARKHIAWALEATALSASLPPNWTKYWRSRLLAEVEPARVINGIQQAYETAEWKAAA